jgi:predicted Zn-dependent protease with MMP-like domain
MDLHQWMLNDLAAVRDKLLDSVVSLIPTERWLEQVDGGGSSVTHLLLHIARHQDLAVTSVIRNHDTRFLDHRDALGLLDAPVGAGLSEREDTEVSRQVAPDALLAYVREVFDATQEWLEPLGSMVLEHVPDSHHRLTHHGGLQQDEVPWLYRMWHDQPIWWFIQWPVIGHGNAHVGEGISLRNRMGLSPF